MVKRDFYAILGVPARAEPSEIKRAYRRLAFSLHPDVGREPDPLRFHEVQDAYEVLSNPEQRRAYDRGALGGERVSISAEPMRAKDQIRVFEDHLTVRPTIEELIDHISQNYVGYRSKTGGPYRRLAMEAILEPDEVRFGCRVPLSVPCFAECLQCSGSGTSWAWNVCPRCYGRGMVEMFREAIIEIPPGTRDGEHYEVDLSGAGIRNLVLDVRIVVP